MDILFAAVSTRYLTITLRDKIQFDITKRTSRGLRVLWYMREMGGGWLSESDLTKVGAGYWRTMKYILPDLLKDELIDSIQFQKRGNPVIRYKINERGFALLEIVERHIRDKYLHAHSTCKKFKKINGIS